MNILELSELIEEQVVVRSRRSSDKDRWYASFEHADVMRDGCLVGVHGNGEDPMSAITNYCSVISGARIAIGFGEDRREYQVPLGLTNET